MSNANFGGMTEIFMPNNPDAVSTTTLSTANTTMDTALEVVYFVGYAHLEGRAGSKTFSSAGATIEWRSGTATVFANAGTTIRVGIQSADLVNGPPGRGNGTFDVYKDLVGATDTIAASSWITTTMSTGTKTISHGDQICVAFSMPSKGGVDVLNISQLAIAGAAASPVVTLQTAVPAYSGQSTLPNIVLRADDGTYAFLRGGFIFNVSPTTTTYNSGSATNEFGNIFQSPGPVLVDGLWACSGTTNGSSNYELILYSDPLGTPVAERTVAIDANTNAGSAVRLLHVSIPTFQLAANANYAVTVRPTTANSVSIQTYGVNAANHFKGHSLGPTCYGVSRAGNAGAFTAALTTRYSAGVIVGGISDGAGGSVAMPVSGRICA